MEQKNLAENLWRVWVDTRRRIVSFHEEEGWINTQACSTAISNLCGRPCGAGRIFSREKGPFPVDKRAKRDMIMR